VDVKHLPRERQRLGGIIVAELVDQGVQFALGIGDHGLSSLLTEGLKGSTVVIPLARDGQPRREA
jgi:hypothetical protein